MRVNKKLHKQILIGLALIVVIVIRKSFLPTDRIVVSLIRCVDGDTAHFDVNGVDEKIRFLSIDAPESNETIEEFGKDAATYICNYLTQAAVIELEFDPLASEDNYGRLLAWIWVDDKLLQEEILKVGLAEVAYLYDDYKYNKRLIEVEKKAQEDQVGMWIQN